MFDSEKIFRSAIFKLFQVQHFHWLRFTEENLSFTTIGSIKTATSIFYLYYCILWLFLGRTPQFTGLLKIASQFWGSLDTGPCPSIVQQMIDTGSQPSSNIQIVATFINPTVYQLPTLIEIELRKSLSCLISLLICLDTEWLSLSTRFQKILDSKEPRPDRIGTNSQDTWDSHTQTHLEKNQIARQAWLLFLYKPSQYPNKFRKLKISPHCCTNCLELWNV